MKTLRVSRILIPTLLASAIAGCASTAYEHSKEGSLATAKVASAAAEQMMRQPAEAGASRRVFDSPGFWVNKRAIEVRDENERLPALFYSEVRLTHHPRASLRDVITILSANTGLRIAIAPDMQAEAGGPLLNQGFQSATTLKGLLDQLSAQQNVSWRLRNGVIEIFRYDTRVFALAILPGATEFSATLGSSNALSAGGSSVSTGQKVTTGAKTNFWDGVRAEIAQMLTAQGKAVVSESGGTVTVTDTPQALNAIESHVRGINEARTRQVMVSVQIYSVDANTKDNYGINWQAFYTSLSQGYKLNLVSGPAPSVGGGNAQLGVILDSGSARWGNTQAVLSALSSQGHTTLVTSSSQVGMSGDVYPVSVIKEQAYLASVSTTVTANAGTQTSLTPGVTTAGLSVTTVPVVLNGESLVLQNTVEFSTIDAINSVSSGGSTIQTPERTVRSVVNKVSIKSGQTLLLTGFQQTQNGFERSGAGSADSDTALLTGGVRNANAARRTLVVLITPYIVANGQ